MRRRFGIPFTILLLYGATLAQPYLPVEPYYVLVGLSALWAVIDSRRLNISEHSSSQLLTPVGLIAWMAIAWPIAFPWYLKVRYHVARGESPDKAGSTAAIRLAFFGIFVVVVVGAAVVMKYFPQITNIFLFSRNVAEQFGGSVNVAQNTEKELTITVSQDRQNDPVANERFARRVANYARSNYAGADSLKSIEVVLQQAKSAGPVTATSTHGRYKWTMAELRAGSAPGGSAAQVASAQAGTRPGSSRAGQMNTASVIPAGAPANAGAGTAAAASPRTPARKPVSTHAYARLAAADPAVRWINDSSIVADIDCDGQADTVVIGRKRAEVHVGLARAADPVPQILIFDVGRNVKGAVCGTRARLSVESLDWDPAERGLAALPGFRRSPTCKGVGLGDGNCTPVHVFWSYQTKQLEWYAR